MYFTMELNLNNIQPTNQPTKVTLTMLADQTWQPFDRLLITSLLFFKEKILFFISVINNVLSIVQSDHILVHVCELRYTTMTIQNDLPHYIYI